LEVRAAVEEAAKAGVVEVVVATTSLTEGINLPVKSVIVANQGAYGAEGYKEYIVGSRLVNAIGRAGRAALETEGIVVLFPSKAFNPLDFDRFDPPPSELQALSVMASELALRELEEAEANSAERVDALLESTSQHVQDFLSFVWFLKAELETRGADNADVDGYLERTLAWQQLGPIHQHRILNVGRRAARAYEATPDQSRRRWAASGLSLTSARILEGLAQELALHAINQQDFEQKPLLVKQLLGDERLESLLGLREAPGLRFFAARRGRARIELTVSVSDALHDWLTGCSLAHIGDSVMGEVESSEFRSEQVAELVSALFEHFLPWVSGILISWVNEIRSANSESLMWPTDIPAFIRWGVDSKEGLELFFQGIQSRRLAHVIVQRWREIASDLNVISWLKALNISQSQELFDPSRSELLEILHILRPRDVSIAGEVLAGGTARIDLLGQGDSVSEGQVALGPISDSDLAEWGAWSSGMLIGTLPTIHHEDIAGLVATGLDLDLSVDVSEGGSVLVIQLSDPGA
jgi:hypothetical protein